MREGPELLQAKSTRARGREGMFFLDAEGVRVLGGHEGGVGAEDEVGTCLPSRRRHSGVEMKF